MKFSEFEEMTKRERLRPKQAETIEGMKVMWAEGMRVADYEMPEAHYVCIYAIGKDESMDVGQIIRIPTHIKMPSGIEMHTQFTDRKQVVMDAAKQWIETNKEVGRY